MKEDRNKELEQIVANIAAECVRVSITTEADLFFNYSPHVDLVECDLYPNGWDLDSDNDDYPLCFKGSQRAKYGYSKLFDFSRWLSDAMGETE